METNMIAVVNPITRKATILHKVGEVLHEEEMWFSELDEWSGFETDRVYDIHFHYDEVFEFYISLYDEKYNYLGEQNIEYTKEIVYNDYDYRQAINLNTLKLQSHENKPNRIS